MSELPAGPTRDRAIKELIVAWNQESSATLQDWLSTLPEGPMRAQADAALGALAAPP